MSAGYSGTPLAKKLGIKEGATVFVQGAPVSYTQMVAPMPEGVVLAPRLSAGVNVIHVFATKRSDLQRTLQNMRKTMAPDAALWISWPKRTSKVPTDITEDTIRELCLPLGLVDIKVCAVDETWSGLKLMIRKELRK